MFRKFLKEKNVLKNDLSSNRNDIAIDSLMFFETARNSTLLGSSMKITILNGYGRELTR